MTRRSGVEDEVAEAHVTPQQHRVHARPVRGPRTTPAPPPARRAVHPATTTRRRPPSAPARRRVPGQDGAQPRRLPGHGVDRRHRVEQAVVHAPLHLRRGLAHVGVEHGRRARDVAADVGITRKGAPTQAGSCSTTAGAGAGTPAAATAFGLSPGPEVVVGEGGLQRRQLIDHPGTGRPEVDEHRLVRHAAPRVFQRHDAFVTEATGHEPGMCRGPVGQALPQCSLTARAPVATYGR